MDESYEVMAQRREVEDARRGYSIGNFGGPVTLVSLSQHRATIKRSGNAQVLEGFAVLYNKAHNHKGRVEIFKKGCFDRTLSRKSIVRFFIDHKRCEVCLGDTDTNLELVDSDVGLGYRLKLTGEALDRLDGRDQISVGYNEIDVAECTILDQTLRLTKTAAPSEIS